MSALIAWGAATLAASTALMLLVLAVRAPVRRWVGPRLGYALWALPALRMVLPPMAATMFAGAPMVGVAAGNMPILFTGPRGASSPGDGWASPTLGDALLTLWLVGAVGLFAVYAVRHIAVCRRLRASGIEFGRIGDTRIIEADVEGPLAFGVFRRIIAVPRNFASTYSASERDLALAHEVTHHARGDLVANWASLAVLAAHWWNPVAWVAIRAFCEDQELAADAHVLAGRSPGARAAYAHVLAKAAGVGAPPACNLTTRSNLKGRLTMLRQTPRTSRQLALGGIALTLLGGAALAATISPPGPSGPARSGQAVTIGVKPDGSGGHALIVAGAAIPANAPLPNGRTLPADFSDAGGCDLKPTAQPVAMVIKGMGATRTYTVMCASALPAPVRATLAEGLASLRTMRASVATQQATPGFPEAERTHALGAIDDSIGEIEATLAVGI